MAKDMVHCLAWCSDPNHDENQKMALKGILVLSVLVASTFYLKRHTWSYIKTKKVIYKPPKFREY